MGGFLLFAVVWNVLSGEEVGRGLGRFWVEEWCLPSMIFEWVGIRMLKGGRRQSSWYGAETPVVVVVVVVVVVEKELGIENVGWSARTGRIGPKSWQIGLPRVSANLEGLSRKFGLKPSHFVLVELGIVRSEPLGSAAYDLGHKQEDPLEARFEVGWAVRLGAGSEAQVETVVGRYGMKIAVQMEVSHPVLLRQEQIVVLDDLADQCIFHTVLVQIDRSFDALDFAQRCFQFQRNASFAHFQARVLSDGKLLRIAEASVQADWRH